MVGPRVEPPGTPYPGDRGRTSPSHGRTPAGAVAPILAGMTGGASLGRGTHRLADPGALHCTVNVPPHVRPGPGPHYGETAAHTDPRGGPQHVWVRTEDGRHPGLLIELRKPEQLPWEARVVHQRHRGGTWVTVQEWLPAGCLERPAPTSR